MQAMTFEQIQIKFDELNNALVIDTLSRDKYFTVGQRICINQLRATLFEQINFLNGEMSEEQLRNYSLPESITKKVEFLNSKIKNEHN